jgi:hypothetical protein
MYGSALEMVRHPGNAAMIEAWFVGQGLTGLDAEEREGHALALLQEITGGRAAARHEYQRQEQARREAERQARTPRR